MGLVLTKDAGFSLSLVALSATFSVFSDPLSEEPLVVSEDPLLSTEEDFSEDLLVVSVEEEPPLFSDFSLSAETDLLLLLSATVLSAGFSLLLSVLLSVDLSAVLSDDVFLGSLLLLLLLVLALVLVLEDVAFSPLVLVVALAAVVAVISSVQKGHIWG